MRSTARSSRRGSRLLQRRAVVVHVRLVQRTGHAEAQGAGLAGNAATRDAGDDVVAVVQLKELERVVDFLLVHLVGEVVLKGATVDLPLAGARNDPDAGDGVLATAQACGRLRVAEAAGKGLGGVVALDDDLGLAGVLLDVALELFDGVVSAVVSATMLLRIFYVLGGGRNYCATWVISNGTGCWAAWGCWSPE